ncbi:MAG: 16S rRNA (guanine(527)-N(7))-methyltransferase RsmG [Cyanobacteria bacterium J06634_6]
MPDTLPRHFDLWESSLNWQPTEAQQALFQRLYEQILVGNQQLNLTRITQPDDFWEKHLWDSLSGVAPWLGDVSEHDDPLRIVDIGTGGGFPGVPAAIALSPDNLAKTPVELTLVDSTRKKTQFLQTLCESLGLPAICLSTRAEKMGQDRFYRGHYDLALIRAVGSAATCAEYVMPLLKVGGQAVLYRGQWSTDETESLMPIIDLLGGELTDLQDWKTPITEGSRHCLFIHKEYPTPNDFPRAVGVPGKSPLT